MKSRIHFIQQVKEKLIKEHGKDKNASFIFGLSGKWGEGKTTFLKDLQKELETENFKVVWINPWKFGNDQISFLRNFLKEVSTLVALNPYDKYRNFINNKDDIRDLNYDLTERRVHWGLLILLLLLIILIVVLWIAIPQIKFLFPDFPIELTKVNGLITSIFIAPFLIPLIGSILTSQQSSKSISTVDKFDDLLSKYLKKLHNNKLVVFIDDLDRVTPEVARNALDNMRVFFDKPQITFVVTGDHTVLERYIGSQTLPSGGDPEKLEEGRRYLKKVFNLYWRLPVPIDSEFEEFLKSLMIENKAELKKIFKNNEEVSKFADYLRGYFDKNFRHVIRFFDTVLFTFKIIINQSEHATKENKKYFVQMLQKPILVVRILMIQELCIPLFEAILNDTGILRKLEDFVEKKDSKSVDEILSKYTFTTSQSNFIKKFLYQEPRFFKNKILEVYAFEPFLYLAAEAEFGDARGLSKEDFIAELQTGDPNKLANSVQNCGTEKIKEATKAVSELLKATPDPIVKSGFVRTLILALTKIPDHFSQSDFFEALNEQDYSQVFTGNHVSNRLEISQEFWRWLDTQNLEKINKFADNFPLVAVTDFDKLNKEKKLGHFGSRVVSKWLRDYYETDKSLALSKMDTFLPLLEKLIVSEEFAPRTKEMINDIFTWGDPDQKEKLYKITLNYLPTGKDELKNYVFNQIKNKSEEIWKWSQQRLNDASQLWKQEELEDVILGSITASSTGDELISVLRYANGKLVKKVHTAWINIGNKQIDLLISIMPQLAGDSPTSFSPPLAIAKVLFEKNVQKIIAGDETVKILHLPSLQKRWLWEKLPSMPEIHKIKKIATSSNNDVIREAKLVLQSWGIVDPKQNQTKEKNEAIK